MNSRNGALLQAERGWLRRRQYARENVLSSSTERLQRNSDQHQSKGAHTSSSVSGAVQNRLSNSAPGLVRLKYSGFGTSSSS